MKHVNGGGGGNGGEVRRIREAPHVDIASERAFLGGCLLDPRLIGSSGVTRADFYSDAHGRIWEAIVHIHEVGELVGTDTVRAYLDDRGQLTLAGGLEGILGLVDTIPQGDFPARRIRALARNRAAAAAAAAVAVAEADPACDEAEIRRRRTAYDDAVRERDTDQGSSPVQVRSTAEIFAPLPPTSFLVPGLHLGTGRPLMWAGYGASAKTLAVQSLALSIASGAPIWGHFDVTAPGVVLHLDYEQGFKATARRYQRLAAGHEIDPARLGDRLRLVAYPRISLDQPDAEDAFARACDGASVVLLDAFKGATPTRDENDSSIRSCLDVLSRVSDRVGCCFIVLHHAGKPKPREFAGGADKRTGPRGSSGIFDACGAVFHVEAGKAPTDPRRVEETKMPADAEGTLIDPFSLRVEDVELAGIRTAGVRVMWAPLESAPSPVERAAKTLDDKLDFMAGVVAANAGKTQAAIARAAGMGKARAIDLLDELEERGRVVWTRGEKNGKHYRPVVGEGGT